MATQTMNQAVFDYIKEKFTSQQHIKDFEEEYTIVVQEANSNNVQKNAAIARLQPILLASPKGTVGVWNDVNIPVGRFILPADFEDPYWFNFALRAIKAQDNPRGYDVSNEYIIKILKNFDSKIPDSGFELNDKVYANAWIRWFYNGSEKIPTLEDPSFTPDFGKPGCFSYLESMTVYAQSIINRVKNFDINSSSPSTQAPEPVSTEQEQELENFLERNAVLQKLVARGAVIFGHDYADRILCVLK